MLSIIKIKVEYMKKGNNIYKPDNTQSASRHLFTIGDVDNPYLIQIEGTEVTDADTVGEVKLEIAGNVVKHEVKTFRSGGKIVFGIGPKEKLTFATLPVKVTITIGAKVGTEQINEKFTLTKAAKGDIYSWRDLDKIRNNLNGKYTLKNDIKFPTENTYGYGKSFTPIGNKTTKFSGKLDGKNHTISDLKIIQTTDLAGLFAYVEGTTAEIKDLIIDHVGISGGNYVGSVAGKIGNNAKITNVGMISSAGEKMTGSSLRIGGLVGYAEKGTTVTGYSTGQVTGSGKYVGGLVGHAEGATVGGYATGDVSGRKNVGGLVGWANSATVTGYATGKVAGPENVGGLVGHAGGATITGYARNTVKRTSGTDEYFGKLVGYVEGTKNTIRGYHSTGESRVLDENGKTLASHKTSEHGTAITMGTGITKDSFPDFKIDEAGSKWEWVKNGSWPAIKIGTIMPKDKQPVQ
jgi:hypothetical protein